MAGVWRGARFACDYTPSGTLLVLLLLWLPQSQREASGERKAGVRAAVQPGAPHAAPAACCLRLLPLPRLPRPLLLVVLLLLLLQG